MHRRLLLAGLPMIAAIGPAHAQRMTRPVRLGFLNLGPPSTSSLPQFLVGLGRLGWGDRRDYVLKTRFASLDSDDLPAQLDSLLRDGIDILIAIGGAARILGIAERSVPVVFSFSGDPVVAGHVASLARPGGNATGNTQLMWELVGKRLELLREIAPAARRTLVVQSPDHPGEAEERSRSQSVGTRLGFEMRIEPVRNRMTLEAALARGVAAKCDSLLCFTDSVTVPNCQLIADFARVQRIPAVYPRREFCDAGGLASYGPNIPELIARLAVFVQRIADGTRAADIPVEWPTLIETIANRRTAEEIGIRLPPVLLARATEVIE